tara:strand:+ start:10057 stop:11361 length:1305 start_codon:yes stop_codon:yes gene_type:complete
MVIIMSGINTIRTIEDLERATYGNFNSSILKSAGIESGIHTAHDSGAFSANALYNLIYGQKVWSMLNREINALAMLPKKPWSSSGWRVLKERALGGSGDTWSTTGGTGHGSLTEAQIGGVAENASFTTAAADVLSPLKPVFDTLYASPKTIAHQFEISELAAAMAKIDDGIGDIMSAYREEIGVSHAEAMNHMLLMPLESHIDSGSSVSGIGNNITSLYKIVSSYAEVDAMDGGVLMAGTQTGNATLVTLYGQTRVTGATDAWLDAYVDYGTSYASRRNLTLNTLNTALRELQIRGGSPKVMLTGYDTIQALGELLQSQERYMGRAEIMPTANGVKGVKGREVGFKVATYHDIPLIPCKEMPSTGSGSGLSDILILDTDHLHFATLKPTEYFEGGIDSGDPFGVNKLGNRGLYRTIGETVCTFFKGQGKITNLQ